MYLGLSKFAPINMIWVVVKYVAAVGKKHSSSSMQAEALDCIHFSARFRALEHMIEEDLTECTRSTEAERLYASSPTIKCAQNEYRRKVCNYHAKNFYARKTLVPLVSIEYGLNTILQMGLHHVLRLVTIARSPSNHSKEIWLTYSVSNSSGSYARYTTITTASRQSINQYYLQLQTPP